MLFFDDEILLDIDMRFAIYFVYLAEFVSLVLELDGDIKSSGCQRTPSLWNKPASSMSAKHDIPRFVGQAQRYFTTRPVEAIQCRNLCEQSLD
jgi:hypothetical protein